MSVTSPTFSVSGLASGLNTSSIIQAMVQAESQPLTALQNQQTALQTQISAMGDLSTKLQALQTAVDNLALNGAVSVQPTSTNLDFTATTAPGAAAGDYTVQVSALATAAKQRSQGYASGDGPVTGGTLNMTVMGTAYSVAITDGESLTNVADAINQSGAPVTASIISDGTNSYLSVANGQTGYPVGGTAGQALALTETVTGTQGQALSMASVSTAANASLSVDGLPVTSQSNDVTGAINGVTISLKSASNVAEDLQFGNDSQGTQAALQTFVTAYNALGSALQAQLSVTSSTDRTTSLVGDPGVQALNQQLQSLTSTMVPGLSGVRSLADLGITTAEDGSISLNAATLKSALSQNPAAINQIFSQTSTGIGALTDAMVSNYTDPATGVFTAETQGMQSQVKQLSDQQAQMQVRINAYQASLQEQFAEMEQIVSTLKSTGNFLSAMESANSSTFNSSSGSSSSGG
jgi:flagellar hook-associated protein 2